MTAYNICVHANRAKALLFLPFYDCDCIIRGDLVLKPSPLQCQSCAQRWQGVIFQHSRSLIRRWHVLIIFFDFVVLLVVDDAVFVVVYFLHFSSQIIVKLHCAWQLWFSFTVSPRISCISLLACWMLFLHCILSTISSTSVAVQNLCWFVPNLLGWKSLEQG